MQIIDFNAIGDITLCARCRFYKTCHKKTYDIFKPEACDEFLSMHKIIEQKIDTGDILYDHYKNKYGREFRERG